MRDAYRDSLKHLFHRELIQTREQYAFSQAKMAEYLLMDPRSYIELDHGKSMSSSLTFMLYLLRLCPQPLVFLDKIHTEFQMLDPTIILPPSVSYHWLEPPVWREPLLVTKYTRYRNGYVFPVCPRCGCILDREYQDFCDRCGQALDWSVYDQAVLKETFEVHMW